MPGKPALDWFIRQLTQEQEEQKKNLITQQSLNPLLAHLLVLRNFKTSNSVQTFLHGTLADLPDPFLLSEMDQAVDRLLLALTRKERILFFGDYDVDGITATAQLQAYFREMGLPTQAFLPHRMQEGYGLNEKSLAKILRLKPDLLITIDNGTNSLREISFLREKGIDVMVIDHHETPNTRPPVSALINPKRNDSKFPDQNVASAGLAFLLLVAFRSRCRERGITPLPNLKRYLDLACLGTVADLVPLTGVNRLLVKYGLEEIGASQRIGLKALMTVAGVSAPVNTGAVAFRLAPRINAAGRLADPSIALELLLTEDGTTATQLANQLETLNQERQRIEGEATQEAITMIQQNSPDRKGLVAYSPRWHLGVVGIVAAKLTEYFRKPAVVLSISEDGLEARGSARTISGLSVYDALKKIEDEMLRFGGHTAAAGMTVRADNLEKFARRFDESVREIWNNEISSNYCVDLDVPLREITPSLVQELTLLEPYGLGNPEPTLMSSHVQLRSSRVVGAKHLKTQLCQEGKLIDAIGFSWASYLETSLEHDLHTIAFSPQINEWNGNKTLQLKIKNMTPTT
ncbi:MAG: single-stranded-DNA-specific exonuclease RecJ [Deltaproteobacteria bacterium]|nr:single-stranded-DNA-specific exonuclease RecJ [Deltaproteobacteria bacterium]